MLDSIKLIPLAISVRHSETGEVVTGRPLHVDLYTGLGLSMFAARLRMMDNLMNTALEIQTAMLTLGWRP